MMTVHRFLAIALAFLLAGIPVPARPEVLGVVVQADRAHLNTSVVSAGTTVYDGDQFSTDEGGTLRLRSDAAMLDLAEESHIIVRSRVNAAKDTEALLTVGTVVFSASRATAMEIQTQEARIRPVADAPTIGQVSVDGPKELRVYARRGALQFSYRDETETIAEGQSYRVVLDPPEGDPKKEQSTKKPGRPRKAFLFIVIGGGAAALGRLIHEMIESPDRP